MRTAPNIFPLSNALFLFFFFKTPFSTRLSNIYFYLLFLLEVLPSSLSPFTPLPPPQQKSSTQDKISPSYPLIIFLLIAVLRMLLKGLKKSPFSENFSVSLCNATGTHVTIDKPFLADFRAFLVDFLAGKKCNG